MGPLRKRLDIVQFTDAAPNTLRMAIGTREFVSRTPKGRCQAIPTVLYDGDGGTANDRLIHEASDQLFMSGELRLRTRVELRFERAGRDGTPCAS